MLQQINATSASIAACLTRVLNTSMPNYLRQDDAAEAEGGAPAAGGADPALRPAQHK